MFLSILLYYVHLTVLKQSAEHGNITVRQDFAFYATHAGILHLLVAFLHFLF